jgi:cation-transporting ATPase 13A1
MYLGILAVSGLAFACSTEFIPELNEKMKLVPFNEEFRFKMTATMVVDYVGCYVIEKGLKAWFSDYRPKDIAIRRPEQLVREEKRQKVEAVEEAKRKKEELARIEQERREKAEKALADFKARWGQARA